MGREEGFLSLGLFTPQSLVLCRQHPFDPNVNMSGKQSKVSRTHRHRRTPCPPPETKGGRGEAVHGGNVGTCVIYQSTHRKGVYLLQYQHLTDLHLCVCVCVCVRLTSRVVLGCQQLQQESGCVMSLAACGQQARLVARDTPVLSYNTKANRFIIRAWHYMDETNLI